MTQEALVRAGFFFFMFASIGLWEVASPRREYCLGRLVRWPSNLGILALNGLLVRFLLPGAEVGVAVYAQIESLGVLNRLEYTGGLVLVLSVILLDLVIYWQHRLFHWVPWLWRIHRVHHADQDFDVTTGSRFHPLEIVLSLGIKALVILALGLSPLAVLAFSVLLNATAMFNHGNILLPLKLDALLRRFLVTPDMHRVHHSVIRRETDSNFGFNLSIWDRLFRSYISQPEQGHSGMTIGLSEFRTPRDQRLDQMLLQPFRKGDPVP